MIETGDEFPDSGGISTSLKHGESSTSRAADPSVRDAEKVAVMSMSHPRRPANWP